MIYDLLYRRLFGSFPSLSPPGAGSLLPVGCRAAVAAAGLEDFIATKFGVGYLIGD